MTFSDPAGQPEDTAGPMPAALPSMIRVVKLGYRAEPRLLLASLAMTLLQALPDVLVALWLALVTNGLVHHDHTLLLVGALGLALSATMIWALQVTLTRTIRRLGDRLNIMFQGHVARLQAEVATVEHHERPVFLDRIAVLRTGVFALDHLFASMFTMVGWLVRLAFVSVLLAAINPWLLLLLVGALPLLVIAVWRPKVEKRTEERVASHGRLGRHVFSVATSPPPGKEIRVTGNQDDLVRRRRAAWEQWFGALRVTQLASAAWLTGAWTVFSLAFVVAVAWVATGLDASPGAVVLVLTAGGRLSAYVGSAVGELGFLRGIWLDSAQRLAWLEDFTAQQNAHSDLRVPDRLEHGRGVRGRLVRLPRHDQAGAGARRPGAARWRRDRDRRRERCRQVHPGQAPGADVHTDLRADHRRRRRHQPHRRVPVAGAAGRGLPGLRPAGVRRCDHRRPGGPAAARRPGCRRLRRRPGRGDDPGLRPARRAGHPARPVVGRRRRRQLRSVAEARPRPRATCARSRCC